MYKKYAKAERMENNNIGESKEVDIPSYLNDFLECSKKTIFITGNNNINKNPSKNTKKKIIKKKKKLLNNIKSINKEKEEKEKKNTNEIGIKTNKKKIFKNVSLR